MQPPLVGSLLRSTRRRTVGERICFVHVPKCGGTSLDWAMREAFGIGRRLSGAVYRVDSRASEEAAGLAGMAVWTYREQLLLYQLSKRRARYISGHFPYTSRIHDAFSMAWAFVTVLRHPVDRWFSLYFYDRSLGAAQMPAHESLAEYVDSTRGHESAQFYVRMFGDGDDHADSDAAVERACRHLDSFSLVGILEEVDRFAAAFRQRFGVSLSIGRQNRNPAGQYDFHPEITPAIRSRVEELCRHDLRVYEYARRRLM